MGGATGHIKGYYALISCRSKGIACERTTMLKYIQNDRARKQMQEIFNKVHRSDKAM